MSRSVVVSLVVSALVVQAAFAITIDVSKTKNIEIPFTDKDIVPKTEVRNLVPKTYDNSFIGDLEVGKRHTQETILRQVIVFTNPLDSVETRSVVLKANGKIHYVSIQNEPGSYAVVCDHSNTLGSTNSIISLRVPRLSKSTLSVFFAADY